MNTLIEGWLQTGLRDVVSRKQSRCCRPVATIIQKIPERRRDADTYNTTRDTNVPLMAAVGFEFCLINADHKLCVDAFLLPCTHSTSGFWCASLSSPSPLPAPASGCHHFLSVRWRFEQTCTLCKMIGSRKLDTVTARQRVSFEALNNSSTRRSSRHPSKGMDGFTLLRFEQIVGSLTS